ncbi:MAG TPA: DUF881 domain-containing protein [Nocardioidaceae bacterium]|nr:DUF881 domain-containing protein [Nocardioidaceae bacterium]
MAVDQRRPEQAARPVPDAPPQAVRGLLEHLTSTSLDEDYAHVSRRRAAAADAQPSRPDRPGRATAVLAVFGVLVATAAVQTSRDADASATSREALVDQANARKTQLAQRRTRVQALQSEIAALEASGLEATTDGRAAQQQLTRLGVLAGSRPTEGAGIRVLVDDAPDAPSFRQQVQAPDLQKLVNALWLVGAEAVAVNGQRVTSLTSIRDAAGAITVNFVSLRRPYTVAAIGNPTTMGGRLLDSAGGQTWVTLQSTFGLGFEVETVESMVLPAARRLDLRAARAPGGRR